MVGGHRLGDERGGDVIMRVKKRVLQRGRERGRRDRARREGWFQVDGLDLDMDLGSLGFGQCYMGLGTIFKAGMNLGSYPKPPNGSRLSIGSNINSDRLLLAMLCLNWCAGIADGVRTITR